MVGVLVQGGGHSRAASGRGVDTRRRGPVHARHRRRGRPGRRHADASLLRGRPRRRPAGPALRPPGHRRLQLLARLCAGTPERAEDPRVPRVDSGGGAGGWGEDGGVRVEPAQSTPTPYFPSIAPTTEQRTLTLTLYRFAVEGTLAARRLDRVPSPAKRERVRVRVCDSMPMHRRNKRGFENYSNSGR